MKNKGRKLFKAARKAFFKSNRKKTVTHRTKARLKAKVREGRALAIKNALEWGYGNRDKACTFYSMSSKNVVRVPLYGPYYELTVDEVKRLNRYRRRVGQAQIKVPKEGD